MNLRDIHYLVAVADTLHFGKAAELCAISQPTLSMQLKKLEEQLGVILFERTHKQVMITPIGAAILERARRILQEEKEIRTLARNSLSPFTGDFLLGAFPTLAPYFLPHIIPAIHVALPALRLLLVEEKTEVLLQKLRSGTLDAALIALPVQDGKLVTLPLMDDPFLLAVPSKHKLAKKSSVTLDSLAGEELLLLEEGHCLRDQALSVCHTLKATESGDFRATSLETLRQMVAAGVGITLIPRLAMRHDDGITYIPFASPAPSRSIGLVWRASSPRKACIEKLAQIIKSRSHLPKAHEGRTP